MENRDFLLFNPEDENNDDLNRRVYRIQCRQGREGAGDPDPV